MVEVPKVLSGYKFIDLFAGIGGFHISMTSLGAKCVFASEIDELASLIYKNNFDIKPSGDIRSIKPRIYQILIYYVQGFHVNLFLLLDKERDLMIQGVLCFLKLCELLKKNSLKYYF